MKEKCVIVGAGTYGQVYAEYLKSDYDIIGFVDDNVELVGQNINGNKVLGNFKYLLENISKEVSVFIPIGTPRIKESILNKLIENGFKTPNYIHPTVNIEDSVVLGDRAIYVLENTIIMPLSELKNGVMISAGTIISHHATIGANAFISFGVNVGASLKIMRNAYLGIGSTIMTGVNYVGENSIVGAGAVVIRDVPNDVTVVGNPAKILYKNSAKTDPNQLENQNA